ncbi:MAG: class I SAM-dependent methyltransferase, partial [Parcubacteria group bacterium]
DFLARYEFASKFVKNKKVLDIACGAGYGTKILKQQGDAKSVDGVDVSVDVIKYAKENFSTKDVNFLIGDVITFGETDNYDVIVSVETIEHVNNYKSALKNLHRILKKAGTLLIGTPNRIIVAPHNASLHDPSQNPFHCREFSIQELKDDLRQAGFHVEDENVFGNRQQKFFKNKYLRRLYKIIRKPDIKSNPKFEKIYASPRFFIIVANK